MPKANLAIALLVNSRVYGPGECDIPDKEFSLIKKNHPHCILDKSQKETTPEEIPKSQGVDPLNPQGDSNPPEGDKPPVDPAAPPVQNPATAQNQAPAQGQAPTNQNKTANPKNQGQAQG